MCVNDNVSKDFRTKKARREVGLIAAGFPIGASELESQ